MTKRPTPKRIPEFPDAAARERWFMNNAEYFTIVRRVGLSYERHERRTFAEALAYAQLLAERIQKPYMIYAVVGQSDTWVRNVMPY